MRHALAFAAAISAIALPCSAAPDSGGGGAPIVIGQSVPLTGASAELGKQMRAGAQAYFDHINKRGGIHGRKIVLDTMDDGFDPQRATANYNALIQERGAFLIFGCIGAATCNAAVPVISQANVPFVAPANGNEIMRTPFNRNIFHTRASFANEVEHIIDHLTTVGVTKIAVFHPDHAPGRAALATAEATLKKLNLRVAASATYPGENVHEIDAGVRAIGQADAQAVIIFGPYKLAAKFIAAMKNAGHEPQFMTLSVVGSEALAADLAEAGRGVGISQVVPYPWVDNLPILVEYRDVYVRDGKGVPSFTSLEAFIGAKVLVEGLRRAGAQPTREKFVSAMESMREFNAGGLTFGYDPKSHAGTKYVELTVIGKDRKILR